MPTPTVTRLRTLVCLTAVWGLGCSPTEVVTLDPLSVINVAPSHGAVLIDPGTTVLVTFSRDVDPGSVSPTTVFVSPLASSGEPGDPVPGKVTYSSEGFTVVLTPDAPLDPLTSYQLTVTEGVRDIDGRPLAATVTAIFTTA